MLKNKYIGIIRIVNYNMYLLQGRIQTNITGEAIFKGHTLILIKYLFRYIICYFLQSRTEQKKIYFYSNCNKKIYHYNFVTLEV
jgi:hypothetical protein